jgi:lipopolysaccharide transport protein LptA
MLMANMYRKIIVIGGALLVSLSLAHAQDYGLQPDMPINIDADSSDFNYTTNKLSFTGLRVTQGNMSIEADYAETDKLDFDDGLWVFNGNVRIEAELAVLTCDNARLTFKHHQLYNADMDGKPARFEQTDPETGKVNQGEAGLMTYNLKEGTVTLSENAVFKDGANRMSGSSITYDVVSRRIRADAGEDGAVRIMIDPNSSEVKKYTD